MSKGISGLKINALCVKNAMHKSTIVIDTRLYVSFISTLQQLCIYILYIAYHEDQKI